MTSVWQKRTIQFYSVILVLLSSMPLLQGKEYQAPISFWGMSVGYSVCMILCNVMTVVIALVAFYEILEDEIIALWSTALYVLSIYRIYTLCIATDFSGAMVMMVFPGIVVGIYRLCSNKKKTDRRMLILFLLCMMGYMILQKSLLSGFRDEEIRWIVSQQKIQEKGLLIPQLAFHFWKYIGEQPGEGMQYSKPIGVGLVLIVGLILFLVLWFSGMEKSREGEQKDTRIGFTKLSAIISILCLIGSLNSFPWDILQQKNSIFAYFIGYMETPHVLLRYGTFFLVTVFGELLVWGKTRKEKIFYHFGILLILVSIVTSSMYCMDYIGKNQEQYYVAMEQE